MTKILRGWQRLHCVLHGHDAYLHFEQHRISLRCVACGYQTPGWNLQPNGDSHDNPKGLRHSRTANLLRLPLQLLVLERRPT